MVVVVYMRSAELDQIPAETPQRVCGGTQQQTLILSP